MYIILKLICENLSTLAVKVSFLWDLLLSIYAASIAASVATLYISNMIECFTSGTYMWT